MATKTLTAANSVYTLSVLGIFSAPQKLQGYSTDAAFATPAITPVEVMMGVDGRKSSGFTPVLFPQTITLQADSKSNDIFDQWYLFMQANREDFTANATISIPGLGKKFNCVNGSLTSYVPIAEARKVLQPRAYTITWESITPSVL